MEKLQKLNTDLRSILEDYFKTNIWTDWKDISALHPKSSSSSSLFRDGKCTNLTNVLFVTISMPLQRKRNMSIWSGLYLQYVF